MTCIHNAYERKFMIQLLSVKLYDTSCSADFI